MTTNAIERLMGQRGWASASAWSRVLPPVQPGTIDAGKQATITAQEIKHAMNDKQATCNARAHTHTHAHTTEHESRSPYVRGLQLA